MEVYWLEQTDSDVPQENDWLSTSEVVYLDGLRVAKRRAEWRLGRWTAKCALATCLKFPVDPGILANIEIRPSPSGAPEVFLGRKPSAVSISLSHREGVAMCAVALSDIDLGCDLELVEPHSPAFIADYLTDEEQELVLQAPESGRFLLVALLWSGKESVLKALHVGLRLSTRSINVTPGNGSSLLSSWRPFQATCSEGRVFLGWWQHTQTIVRTMVADPPSDPPIHLVAAHVGDLLHQLA